MLHQLLESQPDRTSDAVAVIDPSTRITFRALNARVERLARVLRDRGVRGGDVVALLIGPSALQVIALLAIAKNMAVSVALDPGWPPARLAEVIRHAQPKAVIVTRETTRDQQLHGPVTIEVDEYGPADEYRENGDLPQQTGTYTSAPAHPFCISYTSGSTGTPKGVVVGHEAIGARVAWARSASSPETCGLTLLCQHYHSTGFARDCLGSLANGLPVLIPGASVVSDPAALIALANEESVTHWCAPPALWAPVLDMLERRHMPKPRLQLGRTGGEAVRPALADAWRRVFPGVPLLHVYGTTECSTAAVADVSRARAGTSARLSAGRPVDGVTIRILDDRLNVVADGAVGEIFMTGPNLAEAYFKDPSLTAERFLPDPHGACPGARLYRTGDYGRRRGDGELEVPGRLDNQVNIRGFRVDLGEIESVLEQCPKVTASAVVSATGGVGDEVRLIAYVTLERRIAATTTYLRTWLEQRVPSYMLPHRFVVLKQMPLAASGKIDREALRTRAVPAPRRSRRPAGKSDPSGVTGRVLAIWSHVIGTADIGLDVPFIELGGHSLHAMQIAARVNEQFSVDFRLDNIFEHQTVRALAAAIARRS
jgi:amino acid adenylation domain-containing protein